MILQIDNLSYRYASGQLALDGVCLTAEEGETIGLVGPSGAGKSTLLLHLNGLLPGGFATNGDDSAAVQVAGLPINRENLPEIRKRVGLVFQDPDDQLFSPTVREDVAFGPLNFGLPGDEVERRVAESLQAVGLDGIEARSPMQLSLGERKRVCLAGVLACQPNILALDEPFSGLDPRARNRLLENLRQFEGTQIVATHDLDLILTLCHRVILLDEGRVCAEGPTETLLADRALMEQHGLEVPLRLQLGLAKTMGK